MLDVSIRCFGLHQIVDALIQTFDNGATVLARYGSFGRKRSGIVLQLAVRIHGIRTVEVELRSGQTGSLAPGPIVYEDVNAVRVNRRSARVRLQTRVIRAEIEIRELVVDEPTRVAQGGGLVFFGTKITCPFGLSRKRYDGLAVRTPRPQLHLFMQIYAASCVRRGFDFRPTGIGGFLNLEIKTAQDYRIVFRSGREASLNRIRIR